MAGIPLTANFTVNTNIPLDDRALVADNTARDAIVSGQRYIGMMVYVTGTKRMWQLQAGITNSDWVDVGGGVKTAASGLTAFAGGGQSSATALTADINEVSTCATDGDSVKLKAAVAGASQTVINHGAKTIAVFPQTGEQHYGLAANASVNLKLSEKNAEFVCYTTGIWERRAGGGGGASVVYGSNGTPRSVGPSAGITEALGHMGSADSDQLIYIVSSTSSATTDMSASPQIQNGTVDGQTMELVGTSNTAVLRFIKTGNLDLDGEDWYSYTGNRLKLRWNHGATKWQEQYRRSS